MKKENDATRAKNKGIKAQSHIILWGIVLIVLLVTSLIVGAYPVYADTPNPDSTPSMERIHLYRNLLETGDILLTFQANIPYATIPDTSVSETFIWRLIDTDGTTVLGSTVGYAYHNDGYGYNVFSMYFSAADVTALGIVWGTAYTIRLSGNPAVFITPPIYNYSIASADYTTETTTANNQAALASEIIYLASDLNIKWGLASAYFLTTETETGTVLSIFGETFFRGAIYGVQAMAPTAFSYILLEINADPRSWNNSYVTQLEGQYAGTWVETARNASRDFLGTTYDLTTIILLLVLCGGLIIGNLMITGDHWNGLIDSAFVIVMAPRLGAYSLTYLGLICALCFIYIGIRLWKSIPT